MCSLKSERETKTDLERSMSAEFKMNKHKMSRPGREEKIKI